MKRSVYKYATFVLFFLALASLLTAQQNSNLQKVLNERYNLSPRHSRDTQYYEMKSRIQTHAPDGSPQGWDTYRLYLRCVPSNDSSKGDEYTCLAFTFQLNQMPEVSIPSLANWKYLFRMTGNGHDDKGHLLGIDTDKFEKLTDENGKPVPGGNTFYIYNTFIDFHSMSVFSEKPSVGNGIQNLRRIGDKTMHAAAFSQVPIVLGSHVAEGSYFKNGEVTLVFKGLAVVGETPCALLEYDSGESSFHMLMKPMPTVEVATTGSSHYWGDIYKNLYSGWMQKATLQEVVVSETTVRGTNNKVNTVAERSIEIINVKYPRVSK